MRIHATLTFGLALALIGLAGPSVAAERATTNPVAYNAAAPYGVPAYGQPYQAPTQAKPSAPQATTQPRYGYGLPQAGYNYPPSVPQVAPVATAPVAVPPAVTTQVATPPVVVAENRMAPQATVPAATVPAVVGPVATAPAYRQLPYGQQQLSPQATTTYLQASVATAPAQPMARAQQVAPTQPVGVGGYPMAPVQVAQTLPPPPSAAPSLIEPSTAPVETPAASPASPATESWSGYTAPPTDYGMSPAYGAGDSGAVMSHGGYCDSGCDTGCDLSGGCSTGPSRQWFFGLYGLYLERTDSGRANAGVMIDPAPTTNPYYPTPTSDTFLYSSDIDTSYQGGAEIRFGSTLGCAVDPCTGCHYQPLAWEVAYWAITDDPNQAVLVDDSIADTDRIYGMRNYAGLEYDRDGAGVSAGYRPLNDYTEYQIPIDGTDTDTVRLVGVRVRSNFEAQNLELNLWRFGAPSCAGAALSGGGCGLGVAGCGSEACGSPCGYDTCGASCGSCAAPKRFFISGLAGLRYFRTDETLQTAFSFTDNLSGSWPGDPTGYPGGFPLDDPRAIFDEIEIDNELIGFQLGCSLNRLMGCKWTLFCDSNFGVYNNNIEKYQRVYGGGDGVVRFVGTGGAANIRSDKNDVAFLGELRAGVAYQISCRARLTAAWRAIAMSGVAVASNNIPADYSSVEAARYIDSTGSIILHGLQAGVEFKY